MLTKKRILSINVSYGQYKDFVETIFDYSSKKMSKYVCLANVHMLVEARLSKEFQQVVNEADIVAPDGMPIAKSLGLLYNIKQQRVDGAGLMQNILAECAERDQSVYFYGGTEEILVNTEKYLKIKYPALKISGMCSPPFRALTSTEKNNIIRDITSLGPNLVFVVLGCPKQEAWMNEMKGKIPALMVGIGGALPLMIGIIRRAPLWVQKIGMEWFFRFMQEPARLFKRYSITNTIFIWLLLVELFKKHILRKPDRLTTVYS
jgi:N-acetylglucosaminyldiphosphoundecaprenol N-acetyl-beta-D-mannosaminyltransferase